MEKLKTVILPVNSLAGSVADALFDVYAQHYDGISRELFLQDLANKDHILIVEDSAGIPRGFTTIAVLDQMIEGKMVRAVFSGDTVMHRDYWGRQDLAFNWIRFAGSLKKQEPERPLYWFLIVKGHRTYRYLSAFSLVFFPHWRVPTPQWEQSVMHAMASSRFGAAYNPAMGIVHFPVSRGHLKPAYAHIPENDARRDDVSFFLRKNPDYANGDELVCLTELRVDSLKPIARRLFQQGWSE